MASITLNAANVKPGSASQTTGSAVAFSTFDAGSVVFRSTDGKWRKAQANTLAAAGLGAMLGIAVGSADSADQSVTLLTDGNLTCSGLTVGIAYFLAADTAGVIAPYADLVTGNAIVFVGVATSTTNLNCKFFYAGVVKP